MKKKKQFALFVGSAISGFEKANMPTVPSVKEGILSSIEQFFAGSMPTHIKLLVNDLREKDSQLHKVYHSMAFEALVEVLFETNPELSVTLLQLYSQNIKENISKKSMRHNALHEAIATIVLNGTVPVIYTTNFDECIESVIEIKSKNIRTITKICDNHSSVQVTFSGVKDFRMVKLHGTASRLVDQESIGELASRYKDIAKSLPEKVQNELRNDLISFPFKFIGYGGVDFDINLAFKKIDTNIIKADQHVWFDRAEVGGFIRDPSLATERLKENTKQLMKTKTEFIDLGNKRNAIFEWAQAKKSGYLRMSKDNVPSLPFSEKDTMELLGRILEYLQAPQSRDILLAASKLYEDERRIHLELLSLNGFLHDAEYKKFVSHARDFDIKHSLEEKQRVELNTQMALSSILGFLLVPFLLSHCFLLFALLKQRIFKKTFEIYHLVAYRILLHNIQRIFLALPFSVTAVLKYFHREQLKLERKIKEKGYLRESSYTRREALKMKSQYILQKKELSRQQDDLEEEYKNILENMSDLEVELSVMGAETGTINVLRDIAEFSRGMNDFSTAEYYAIRAKELAESIPGHEIDVEKAKKILHSMRAL